MTRIQTWVIAVPTQHIDYQTIKVIIIHATKWLDYITQYTHTTCENMETRGS